MMNPSVVKFMTVHLHDRGDSENLISTPQKGFLALSFPIYGR